MMTPTKHILPAIGIALTVAGCGTYVPEIQENYWYPDPNRLVEAIIQSIHCEIRNAVTAVINEDRWNYWNSLHSTYPQPLQAAWLNDWGAQMQITLSVDEQSSFSPSGLYSPMKIFFLNGGVSASSEATRIETLNYYYTINDIYNVGKGEGCSQELTATISDHPIGSLLIQSDLKLKEWLRAVVLGHKTGEIPIVLPPYTTNTTAKNAISHEIKFIVITSGNITPMWKLERATINPTGSLFTGSRNRTHDLLITLGPNDPKSNSLGIGTPAANANLAQQIGVANSTHMLTNLVP
jgi:hypothetical protein